MLLSRSWFISFAAGRIIGYFSPRVTSIAAFHTLTLVLREEAPHWVLLASSKSCLQNMWCLQQQRFSFKLCISNSLILFGGSLDFLTNSSERSFLCLVPGILLSLWLSWGTLSPQIEIYKGIYATFLSNHKIIWFPWDFFFF